MDGENVTLAILYRLVYGRCRVRLGRFYRERPPEVIRTDRSPDSALTEDTEFAETIREAAGDAIAGRRPRW